MFSVIYSHPYYPPCPPIPPDLHSPSVVVSIHIHVGFFLVCKRDPRTFIRVAYRNVRRVIYKSRDDPPVTTLWGVVHTWVMKSWVKVCCWHGHGHIMVRSLRPIGQWQSLCLAMCGCWKCAQKMSTIALGSPPGILQPEDCPYGNCSYPD